MSDAHIGASGNEEKVCQFFQMAKQDADRLILNGDILDLWRAPWDEIQSSAAYKELIMTVQVVPTVIVRGNHDFYLTESQVPGAMIVDEFEENGWYIFMGGSLTRSKFYYGPFSLLFLGFFIVYSVSGAQIMQKP